MKAAEMGLNKIIKTKREIKSVFSFWEHQKNTSSTQNPAWVKFRGKILLFTGFHWFICAE